MSLIKLDASVLTLRPYNFPDKNTKSGIFKYRKIVHTVPELISELYNSQYDIIAVHLNSILESSLYSSVKQVVSAVEIVCKSTDKKSPKIVVYAREMTNIPLIQELVDAGYHAISMHSELLNDNDKIEIAKRLMEGKRWLDPISEELLKPISTARKKQNKLSKAILEGRVGYFVCPLINCDVAASNISRLKNDLNLTCCGVSTLQELFPILASPVNQVDIIWLDAESISNNNGSNYIDIINTITTLLNVTGRSDKTHISVVVGKTTPVELIKEIIKTNGVHSISPRAGDYSYEEIKLTCTKILQEKSFVPEVIRNLLKRKKQNRHDPDKLTVRQKQIVELILESGSSNKNIARKLQISESAVKRQLTDILRKTKTTNRTQLALVKKDKVAE